MKKLVYITGFSLTLSGCGDLSQENEPKSYQDTSNVQVMCAHYREAEGVGLDKLSIDYWEEATPGSEDMSRTAGGSDRYTLVSIFKHDARLVFSLSATKDGQAYYPFDTCDYPGGHCSGQGDECVTSVGTFWWTLGDCDTNGKTVWKSDRPHSDPGWVDNPDDLGMCTANGEITIP